MSNHSPDTEFAPAERAPQEVIKHQVDLLRHASHFVQPLYEAVTEIVMILNKERQIVFFNNNLLQFLNADNPEAIYGMRVGEAVRCVHAAKLRTGCGTTEFCRTCGAANAIINSQTGTADKKECRISREENMEALELEVKATPLNIEGEAFTIFAVKDISHEKRRRALEQIFFHDVMNTASCILMASELLPKEETAPTGEIRQMLLQGVSELIEEIESQKMLAAAEHQELKLKPASLSSGNVLTALLKQYEKYAQSKEICLELKPSPETTFTSDQTILLRVLGNMLKNAIEASRPGETVTLSMNSDSAALSFSVHNNAVMPRNVQLQLFQRSFTTKGSGRGLGTYSMKLLTERYLKGQISFTSNETDGTTFIATYPLQ